MKNPFRQRLPSLIQRLHSCLNICARAAVQGAGLLLLASLPAFGDLPAYTQPASVLNSAGQRLTSPAYTQEVGDLNMLGAPMSSAAYAASPGFVPSVQASNTAPTITSNGGGAADSIDVAENTTAVTTVVASDTDLPAQTITYSKSGPNSGLFNIDSGTGSLTFTSAPNFETGPGPFSVTVTATDNGIPNLSASQDLTINVTNVNEAPEIGTFGSLPTFPLDFAEGVFNSVTYASSDPDAGQTLTYSTSGADAALFDLTPAGVLTFVTPRDFETRTDANTDGVYEVTITITDNGAVPLSDSQALVITVTNRNEAPTFTGGSSPLHTADTGAKTVPGWATAMDDGDSTVTQALTFTVVQNGGAAIFSTAPTIAADGTLSYTLNGSTGTANLYAYLTDDNAVTPHAALNSFPNYVFTITNQTLPDYQVTYAGGALTVTDLSGVSGTTLYLYERVDETGRVRFFDGGRTFSVNGGLNSTTETSVSFLMTDLTSSVTMNAGAGNNTIRVQTNIPGNVLTLPSLTINGGAGDDNVQFAVSVNFLPGASLDVDLQNDAGGAGLDTVSILSNVLMPLLGTGSATIKSSGSILLSNSAQLITVDGNLTLEANQQAVPSVGSFNGITLNTSSRVQASGTGQVTVKGRSGNGTGRHGVVLNGGASISGGTTGTLSVTAVSNATSAGGACYGLLMGAPASMISTTGANIVIEGTTAATGGGNGGGVWVDGSVISAGGAGTVSVTGTGGSGGFGSSYGVVVWRSGGTQNGSILSNGGDVTVVGNGGSGTNGGNHGVYIFGPADIRPGTNGNLSITGTCSTTATGGGNSVGVSMTNAGATLGVSGTGTLLVNGTGGNASGGNNSGVLLNSGGSVPLGSGNVTITGTAGIGGGSGNQGVNIGVPLTSTGGNISITGTGKGVATTNVNHGVTTNVLSTTGSGTITVQGTAATTAGGWGFQANGAITTAGGSISLTGVGGGAGTDNNSRGVMISNVAVSGPAAGSTLTIHGTGSTLTGAGNLAVGVELYQAGAQVSTTGGDIAITGVGGANSSQYSMGFVLNGGTLSAGGTGKINLTGTGGANLGITYGVWLLGGSISTNNGDITLTGTAGGQPVASPNNFGIQNNVNVIAGGTGNILLAADSMSLGGSLQAVGDSITARPRTAGTPILIGGNDVLTGSLALGLTDSELDSLNCATVNIGAATSGPITVSSGISPANHKTFALKTNTSFSNAAFFSDIGATASVFEKITVEGTVTVDANSQLNFSPTGGYVPALGDSFKIIDNDGTTDAVTGTFFGKAEGATITNFVGTGLNARITYLGGDGNDVVVTVQNIAPVITSNGGGATASISVAENTTLVTTVTFTDPDAPQTKTYSLSGTDAALFNLNSGGFLTFIAPPDFEGAHGNTYTVTVAVTDNGAPNLSDSQDLTISVTNANEMPVFVKGGDKLHPISTATAQSFSGWATGIDDGDSTVTQGLTFNIIGNTNPGLFTTTPTITSAGELDYTPNGTAGTATISVTLTDDASINSTAALTTGVQTFTISVEGPPNYSISTAGNAIVITDLSGNTDTLALSQPAAGNIAFAVPGRTFSINGALQTIGNSGNVPLAGVTSVTVHAAAGNDTINVGGFTGSFPSLTINGGTGNDTVNMNGSMAFVTNGSLDLDLQNDNATPGIDSVIVANNAIIQTSGTGTIMVKVSRSAVLNSGSRFETVDGGIILEGNQQAVPVTGGFISISINGTVSSLGTGAIAITGRGGDDAASSSHYGVYVGNGLVSSSGTGAVTLTGRAGISSANGFGVAVSGSTALVASTSGKITLDGTGATGSGDWSLGVFISNGAKIRGTSTAQVEITGHGGGGVSQGRGIQVQNPGSEISVVNGDLTMTGFGGTTGTGHVCIGLMIQTGPLITSTGSGKVFLNGTGGSGSVGTTLHIGIYLGDTTAVVSSGSGDVQMHAIGGPGGVTTTSQAFYMEDAAGTKIDVSAGSANLAINANAMTLGTTNAVILAGSNTVTLRQKTNGTLIDLGGSDAEGVPATLGLTDAELDRVTAGTLNIGDSNSGNITVSQPITPASAPLVNLSTGGSIKNTNTGTTLTVANSTSSGTLAPGASPGIFSITGNHSLVTGSTFSVEIGGITAGTLYDQLSATGSVTINTGVALNLSSFSGFVPLPGQLYTIISRTGGTGTFTGLVEGALISSDFLGSGLSARISYAADDGDDVVIRMAEPEIQIEQPLTNILVDNSASVDFGTKNVAEISSLTFTLKNVGTSDLTLGAITFDGTNPGDFSVTTAPTSPVVAAGSTTFVVAFMPLQSGARSAVMHIANDDGDENPFDITLTGTGTDIIGSEFDGTTPVITLPPSESFVATGLNFDTDLGFIPTPGTTYTFIDILGALPAGIIGNFNDLPEGGVVAMAFNGVIYYFQANYTGGVGGNDLTLTSLLNPGPANWKWTAGPDARNAVAIFGTEDVGAADNNPGARQGAVNWRAPNGNLWMFGGYGYASALTNPPRYLNDLWEYDRVTGQWIWHSGAQVHNQYGTYGSITVAAAANTPGARHTGTSWTDASGNLWVFGGYGLGASGGLGRLNDLWRFTPGTGQWTWMKGSNTVGAVGVYSGAADTLTPGARQGATGWATTGGNLYLFGGTTDGGSTFHNDLWLYTTGTGNWTLVKGDGTTNVNGTYGTQGTGAPANTPGARRDATGWVAKDGTLWLFGGRGLAATGATLGDMSDLWSFGNGNWTHVSGPTTQGSAGTYTALGSPGTPAARSAGSGWVTVDGDFWLVGGFKDSRNCYNDVWIYDIGTSTWTWQLGSSGLNAAGVYGTKDVAAPGNQPGARFTPSTWVTLNGAIWVFGGGGFDSAGNGGRLSDLWRYGIATPAGAPPEPSPEPFPDSLIVNAAPNASDAAAGTMAYVPVTGQLSGSDADGDKIRFLSSSPTSLSQGTLTLNPDGTWSYTPAPGFVGQSTFQFHAADAYGGSSSVRTLVITVVTNPADSDNDGITDTFEQTYLGGTGADALGDADLDGQSNYFEYLAGTHPVDSGQHLTTAPSAAGSFKLDLNHVRPGVSYHLETSSDLKTWNRIGTYTFSVSGSVTLEDPTPPTGQPQFYRVSLEASTLLP